MSIYVNGEEVAAIGDPASVEDLWLTGGSTVTVGGAAYSDADEALEAISKRAEEERLKLEEEGRMVALEKARKADAYGLLELFCAKYGAMPEFVGIAGKITEFVKRVPA